MKTRWIFILSAVGILAACYAAYLSTMTKAAEPPVFNPAANPYADGIYAEGMVESTQTSGENINMYPEVAGTVKQIFVHEGETVHRGDPLMEIDPSIQQATAEQQQAQAEAARAMLAELKAEPRKETLDVTIAQVAAAEATLKTASDELDKQQAAYKIDPGSISKDALDNAINARAVAETNLKVAQRQYDLTKAGAWTYDIQNQTKQVAALEKAAAASSALLSKYILHAPQDGTVLTVNTIVGAYVSPQGAYDAYTEGNDPVVTFGGGGAHLNVRCYVDEILVTRLPATSQMKATMTIRGTDTKIPLTFVRVQPFVSPKIELSDQRQELVDVRVLPVIFQLDRPANVNLYPGELVDVYIGH
jgi:HlyD family secretion protein